MIRVHASPRASFDERAWHAMVYDRSGPVRRDLDARGVRVRRQCQRRCPVRTARLRGTIRGPEHGLSGSGEPCVDIIAGRVGVTPYLGWVLGGTEPHVIMPRNRQVLRFQVGGQTVFAARVRHPGTRPQPFLQESLGAARG